MILLVIASAGENDKESVIDCSMRLKISPSIDDDASNKSKSGPAQSERIRSGGAHAHLREEVARVVGETDTAKDLTSETKTSDLGAAKLGALEAVEIACADGQFFLEIIGIHDGSECVLRIDGRCMVAGL